MATCQAVPHAPHCPVGSSILLATLHQGPHTRRPLDYRLRLFVFRAIGVSVSYPQSDMG